MSSETVPKAPYLIVRNGQFYFDMRVPVDVVGAYKARFKRKTGAVRVSLRTKDRKREAELAALMPEKVAADTGKVLLCPMPGLVKSIAVAVGQDVKAGEPLAMVEAMKMENVLRAEKDVTIAKILAKEGDSLAVDAVIMEFA